VVSLNLWQLKVHLLPEKVNCVSDVSGGLVLCYVTLYAYHFTMYFNEWVVPNARYTDTGNGNTFRYLGNLGNPGGNGNRSRQDHPVSMTWPNYFSENKNNLISCFNAPMKLIVVALNKSAKICLKKKTPFVRLLIACGVFQV
jgi:hypothetical protein